MYIAVVLKCPFLYNFMQMISNFSISPNGRYVAAVMDNGNINVYSVPALSQHFTKVICTEPCVYSRPITIREFLQRRRQRQRERQNSSRFIKQNNKFCTCITLFCTFLCHFWTTTTRKCLNSRFIEDVNKPRRNFLSLSKLESDPQEINSSQICLH